MKKIKEDKVKFVHSQTIKLKAATPLIPIELNFGNGDVRKFLIERMGSNLIRFVMPILEEEFNKQKQEAQEKFEAIEKAQKIVNEVQEEAKTLKK